MLAVLTWWLIMEILGLAALPLTYRLFKNLPDRGYAFAKSLGLLLTSYVLWIGANFGFLRHRWGGIVFSILAVAVGSWWFYAREERETGIASFLREKGRMVIATEALFALAFALFALFRAYSPEIAGTEKPMEFAFLNAILRSDRFPPHDPWLSGFAISYYYFGYLMMALLTKLSGVPSSVAFNLGIALLFALTMTGAYGLVYDLVEGAGRRGQLANSLTRQLVPLLGSLLVAVVGNLEGLFEFLHAWGIGSASFWRWLDLKDLLNPPTARTWFPTRYMWWWRASRVIHDRDLLGRDVEVIDEFPSFSFILGDMHPHVLALPFVLLALALALNILRDKGQGIRGRLPASSFQHLVLYALCLGGLGFLNTWDFPIYLFVVVMAYALRRYGRYGGLSGEFVGDVVRRAVALGGLGLLLYLPFYIGFQSQAGGLLPNLFWVTKLNQYLVMFGLFIFVIACFLLVQLRWLLSLREGEGRRWLDPRALASEGLRTFVALAFLFPLATLLTIVPILFTGRGRAFLRSVLESEAVRQAIAGQDVPSLLRKAVALRLGDPWLFIALTSMIVLAILVLKYGLRLTSGDQRPASSLQPLDPSASFTLLLIIAGLLLTLSVEFIYLRDIFGTRMNTVFKFYYQAWVMLAIASAYGVYRLASGGGLTRHLCLGGFAALFLAGMVYPLAAGYTRAEGFAGPPTLNGTAYMSRHSPDDYLAIGWLNENVAGAPVVLEAAGGSFSQYARVSSQTGLPTVLGWDFHEVQWRGSAEEVNKRKPDVEALYNSPDVEQALTLLEKYDITYVYVGPLERSRYSAAGLAKFDRFMDVVYRRGDVTIYRRRP